jgi:AcrR family transcriptional regulator
MEKGARKKALDMAAKLLAKGMTMDDVAEAAGLSVEELSNELS